ncbi:MAG: hypothetical protein ACRD2W_14760 [Acidimicrobiales bacterium]
MLAAGVLVVLEYCPWVLGDATSDLDGLIASHFGTTINLNLAADGQPGEMHLTSADLPSLARRFATRGYADLLLLP